MKYCKRIVLTRCVTVKFVEGRGLVPKRGLEHSRPATRQLGDLKINERSKKKGEKSSRDGTIAVSESIQSMGLNNELCFSFVFFFFPSRGMRFSLLFLGFGLMKAVVVKVPFHFSGFFTRKSLSIFFRLLELN